MKGKEGKRLLWHKNNDFPNLDLCESLFSSYSSAIGRGVTAIQEVQVTSYDQGVGDSDNEMGDDNSTSNEAVPGAGNEATANAGGSGGRKRSATTHDPKRSANANKRTRHLDIFNERMSELVGVFKEATTVNCRLEPVEVVMGDQKSVREAHTIWAKEF